MKRLHLAVSKIGTDSCLHGMTGPPTFGPGKVMKAKISTSHGLSDTNAQDYDMTQSMAMLAMDPSFPINAAVPSKSPSKYVSWLCLNGICA